jgi:hypothetical protein
MNVQTIQMPKEAAFAKIEAYKKRLARMRHSKANEEVRKEYEAALQGYKALAQGTPLIDLDDVMQNCPLDEKWRPKLAVARADRKQVRFQWSGGENGAQFDSDVNTWSPRESLRIAVNMGRTLHWWNETHKYYQSTKGFAIVPMVPPDVRPETGQLKDWVILWEVEKWADHKIKATPDIDPYLLKHVGGSLYAVIAEWDLTDLERSIIKGRIS